MTAGQWGLVIPAGRFMGGQLLRFRTKARLESFAARWNETAAKAGERELRFHRAGPRRFEALPDSAEPGA